MRRTMRKAVGAAAATAAVVVALGTQPAGAGPSANGGTSWSLRPPVVVDDLPQGPRLPLGGDQGTFDQDTFVTSVRTSCQPYFTTGFFGGGTTYYRATGNSTTHWVRTTWTGGRSSLAIDPDFSTQRQFSFEVINTQFFCESLAGQAAAGARADAEAAAETFRSMSGPAVGNIEGPDGRTWKTSGNGYLQSNGALSYSGDARLCKGSEECVPVPGILDVSGGLTS